MRKVFDIETNRRKRWTAGYLAFVLPLKAEEVFCHEDPAAQGGSPERRDEWRWIQTAQRLAWQYGEAEALRRLNGYADAHRGLKLEAA